MRTYCRAQGNLLVLSGDLKEKEKEIQKRGDVYIRIADSFC